VARGISVTVELRTIAPPPSTIAGPRPDVPTAEYERRIEALSAAAGAEWVVVYGDREHNANLAFLCGFDPRFEEALLVLGPGSRRWLIVGNEGLGYAALATVQVDVVLAQSLSLMGQRRETAPRLGAVLAKAGIGTGARVAVVGWKYFEPEEDDDPQAPAFVPAFLVRTLQRLIGETGTVRDATHVLSHPESGLKSHNTAAQIAQYAWAAQRANDAVLRIVRGARPGMTEHEAAGLMGYQGEPLSCHVMLVSGDKEIIGLRSPGGRRLMLGDGVTTAVGYWGSLACRAGLLVERPDVSFVEHAVAPYFCAVATWWQTLRIGVTGGAIHDAVMGALAHAPFVPALNPGHLIAIDEWSHTPIRPGSVERITSGMVLQCDIIPSQLPAGQALNCEDTVAVADAALRSELAAAYPELWQSIEQRRAHMHSALGLTLPDELLPLSSAPAYLPPFWLAPDLVCTVAGNR
jgi:hypothetical protein